MSETPKWYVVHTYSGYENKVSENIEKVIENKRFKDLIFDVSVPTETIVEVNDNKKREVERKIFPGYVLVKMILTDESWYVVRNTRGVTGFVGPASKPVPLSEEEVAKLGREAEKRFLQYCQRMIRENYIYNTRIPSIIYLTPEERNFSTRFAPFINEKNVIQIMEELGRAESDISRNASGAIVFFDLSIKMILLIKRAT